MLIFLTGRLIMDTKKRRVARLSEHHCRSVYGQKQLVLIRAVTNIIKCE